MYNNNIKQLVCSDIEHGIPLKQSCSNNIVFLDSFPWFFNKKRILQETHTKLKQKGKLYLINVHEDFANYQHSSSWYGISLKRTQKYFN